MLSFWRNGARRRFSPRPLSMPTHALAAALVMTIPLGGAGAWAATISVPWIGQKTPVECGRAVLASLAARGGGGDPEAMYRRLPAPPDAARGYSVPQMQRFGLRVGVSLSLVAPAGLVIAGECSARPAVSAHYRALSALIAAGQPVVVPVSSGRGAGHYLVLLEAKDDRFTVLDPATPGLREVTEKALAARMCGYGYVALVVK